MGVSRPCKANRRRPSLRPSIECLEDRLTPAATAQELYMLELVNRMRENPAAELPILLASDDPHIQNALDFYNVDLNVLAQQWATLTPVAPLAWNENLAVAARNHSQLMIDQGIQSHQLPGEPNLQTRVQNAGYTNWTSLSENIYAYPHSVFEAHAAFAIDWGDGPSGIQSPPGHRNNIMSSSYRDLGIGILTAPVGSAVGPLVITQDFGNRSNYGNPFLLGTIFEDLDANTYYDIGEGFSGVTITAVGAQTFTTTASAAGGYQLKLPAGTYIVTASGGGLSAPISVTVTIGAANVHRNFIQAALDQPVVFAPATPSTDNTPTFEWFAIDGATGYDLWVDNLSTGQTQVIRQQNLTATTFTPSMPLLAGNYVAWVRAYNDDGAVSAWSADYDFAIELPAIPTPTAPSGFTTDRTPTFTWSASSGAARYDLWVDNLTTGQSQVIRQQNLTANSFTPGTNMGLGNYRFFVRSFNEANQSAGWSAGKDFSIVAVAPPVFAAPSDTTDTTPTFAWTAGAEAVRFDLWVDNLTTGQTQVIRQQSLTSLSFTPASGLHSGSYRAWVRAANVVNEWSTWSAARDFKVLAPAAPTVTGPTDTTDTTPTFAWAASTDAANYDLWVNNTTTGQSQVIRQPAVVGLSFTPTTPLAINSVYRVWVRALNNLGDPGVWSVAHNFLLDSTWPAIPVLSAPPTTTSDLTPTISWNNVSADHYDLWVDYVTGGVSQIIRQQNLTTTSFTPSVNLGLGSYNVWVRSFDAAGQTRGWSALRSFQIVVPAMPTLLGPTGTTSDRTPTFDWSAVANAAKYDLWVDNFSTRQTQVIRQQNLTADSFTPATNMALGNYRFWVRALNAAGQAGAWSLAMNFTIA